MPKNRTVKVKAVQGEPLCYLVQSRSNPDMPYKVDLAHYDGWGFCPCVDFMTRCSPNRKKVKSGTIIRFGTMDNKNPKRTICFHLQVARDKWTSDTLRDISRELRNG